MSSKGLVLVTGANGYIAGRTVEAFLQAGYSVRGTVRAKSSARALQAALSRYGDKLEIVEVPDITAPGAFDAAVKGVSSVAHLASPVSLSFDDPEPILAAAVQGTLAVLESAAREPAVEHFVLLSSVAAIRHVTGPPFRLTEANWNDWAEQIVAEKGKDAPGPVIYSASKALGEKAFWKFRDERKPTFTMTAINPSFVAGPPLTTPASPAQISETAQFVWLVLSGQDLDAAGKVTGSNGFVDLRDVARAVVFAVQHSDVADGQRYLLSASFASPQATADILRKAYPERRAIIAEGHPGAGYLPGYAFPADRAHDASKFVKASGQAFIPFETTVVDTAKVFEALL